MTKLRRGFKSEAEAIARETRVEMGLSADAPIDIWQLARELEIPLVPLSALRKDEPDAVKHFMEIEAGCFSAVTIADGPRRLIVYNDAHAPVRQASDLAHEIAHALLRHRPHPAFDGHGCRDWSGEEEAEADWLGGALLIPESAALLLARRGVSLAQAASEYGVSEQMARFRMNVTNAARRAALIRNRRRSRTSR